MNREEAKQLLPIIQAFAEGKTVQFRPLRGGGLWFNTAESDSTLAFDPSTLEYRIKPEPVVRWGIENVDGTFWSTAKTQAAAKEIADPGARVFKMVEVAE